ncbi:hypothetical protein CERSUDRAFT_70259 [Gelatoporia subvermispora B]|uniref:Uncharacterized protein n=1 Tax=Ceriporiopsis subvermispora (strain B) TaxID=914234 RepID=M2RTL2_CERS8|nr:hypothetical protein CERSUDRAFT_70259 [Gelatoporia subvermispora B]
MLVSPPTVLSVEGTHLEDHEKVCARTNALPRDVPCTPVALTNVAKRMAEPAVMMISKYLDDQIGHIHIRQPTVVEGLSKTREWRHGGCGNRRRDRKADDEAKVIHGEMQLSRSLGPKRKLLEESRMRVELIKDHLKESRQSVAEHTERRRRLAVACVEGCDRYSDRKLLLRSGYRRPREYKAESKYRKNNGSPREAMHTILFCLSHANAVMGLGCASMGAGKYWSPLNLVSGRAVRVAGQGSQSRA